MEYSSSRSRHHHDHDHHHRRRRSRSRSKERSRSRRRSEDRDRDEKRRNERRKDDKKKEDKEIKKVGVKSGESSMSARERMKARIQQQLDKAKVDLKDIKANEVKKKETRDSQDEDEDEDVRQERRVHVLSYDQMVIRDERINEINSHAFKPQTFVSSRDKCKQVDIDEIPLPPTF